MRTLLSFIFILFLSSVIYSQSGFWEVNSEPTGATIYINGINRGETPDFHELAPGIYKVEARYDNYETQAVEIRIVANEVSSNNFVLRKSTGFSVKKEETRTIDQARGKLTVLSEPSGSEVKIDGVAVEKKTPLTVTEIGAGNHSLTITNWMYENHVYVAYSIDSVIHVYPNKTQLLTIDFSKYFGSLDVKSNPAARIFLDEEAKGSTPLFIENAPVGVHTIRLSARLGVPYNDTYTFTENIKVRPQINNTYSFDFYKRFPLSRIQINSNDPGSYLQLTNKVLNKDFEITTGYSGRIPAGLYKASWNGNSQNFSFMQKEDINTHLYLPVQRPFEKKYSIFDVPGYFSPEEFVTSYFDPRPIYKTKSSLDWCWRCWQDSKLTKIMGISGLALMAIAIPVGAAGADNAGFILFGTGFVSSLVLSWPMGNIWIRQKKIDIPQNIQYNSEMMEKGNKEYEKKLKEYKVQLDRMNQEVEEKNAKIRKYNDTLPPASVSYE